MNLEDDSEAFDTPDLETVKVAEVPDIEYRYTGEFLNPAGDAVDNPDQRCESPTSDAVEATTTEDPTKHRGFTPKTVVC